eukprot:12346183-Alexandrium_andersonii.AAC.1
MRIQEIRGHEIAKPRVCKLQSAILQSAIRAILGSWRARTQARTHVHRVGQVPMYRNKCTTAAETARS